MELSAYSLYNNSFIMFINKFYAMPENNAGSFTWQHTNDE